VAAPHCKPHDPLASASFVGVSGVRPASKGSSILLR
jgi:hypothetical protein